MSFVELPWTAGHIGQIAEKLIALARSANSEARTKFNGLDLVAYPDSTVREIGYLWELQTLRTQTHN